MSATSSSSKQNSIFRTRSSSYDGPTILKLSSLPKSSFSSHGSQDEEHFHSTTTRHVRTHSDDSYTSFVVIREMKEEDDDIILEQSKPTVIYPADNQLMSAWSFFASRFSSKSEFSEYY